MNIYGKIVRMDQCANDFFRIAVKINLVENQHGQVMIMSQEHQQCVDNNNNNNNTIQSSIRFVYVFKSVFQQSSTLVMNHFISGVPLLFCCGIESTDLYVYQILKTD